jgi:NADH-quinone oxidoreductase subunit F
MRDQQMLPTWLDASAAALAAAVPPAPGLAGALPGLTRAQALTPLQRLRRLQESGLTECGGAGEQIHLAWRQFLRGRGPSVLVIDATGFDARARGTATVLNRAPWLLAEGVLIAAGLRDSRKVELRLPAELTGREAALLNVADAIRALAQVSAPRIRVEVQRNSLPSCWGEGRATDRSRLVHTPETWCRVALAFAGASGLDRSLLTLRRGMEQRGLVEFAHAETLLRQIENWGGGIEVQGQDAVLVFDDGLGGFLPLAKADLSCDPPSFASAGLIPAPSTLMVVAEGVCLLRQTRRALYRHWQLAGDEEAPVRGLLARAARLIAEITLGRGEAAHLAALHEMALELSTQGLAAAWSLASSLRYFPEQWERHVRRESCPEGICLERREAPCHRTCPANIDIPSFTATLGHGDYRSTIEIIRRDNPLPLTCGLVCPAPCESACVRSGSNGAVFIRPLKSKAAEHCLAEGGYPQPELAPATGKRIGIIGSGPSSLTAAYYLRNLGHDVEIYEAQEHAGGMLRYGIPAYRNPPDLLEKEIDQIRALGVRIFTSAPVASVEEFRKGYDAVFLGIGTQKARLLPVEGAHLPFVLGGIDFLRAARSGESVRVGPRVVVIGGGNVSIDVALTALRQGAMHVDLTSLEKRRDMPASPHEIELAVAEGVQLHPSWGPLRFEEDGVAVFHFCERVKDETGKFDPKFDGNRLLELEADHVILATGQGTDLKCLEGSGVENTRGYIVADPKTKMTTVPGIFAGGDGQHGPRTAVEAIRSGKIAAASIDAWLRGAALDAATGTPVRRAEVDPLAVVAVDRTHLRRAMMPERTVEETVGEGNYVRIEEGLTDAMAHDEARRCLRCDVCIGCGLCMAACSEMGVEALRMADTTAGRLAYFDFSHPADLCIGCGACTQVCPTGAIRLEDRDGVRRTIITGTVVREQPLLACSNCGAPTRTPAHREFVRQRLPDHMAAHLDRELCPSCARRWGDRPAVGGSGRPPQPKEGRM